jgi:hypothetical protein
MRAGLLALGTIVGIGVCSQAMAQSQVPAVGAKREKNFGFNLDTVYDSNIAHTNATLATVRAVEPEEYTFRPSAFFSIVQPIGHQAVFLNGSVGYDFHKNNKQLDRENIDVTGGGSFLVGPCNSSLFGKYAAMQSDLADVVLGSVKNQMTVTAEGASLACGLPGGIGAQLSGQHEDTTNSASAQQTADHTVDGGSLSLIYGRPGLGAIGLVGNYSDQKFPNRLTFDGHKGDEYWNEMLGLNYEKSFGSKLKVQATVGYQKLKRQSAPPGVPLTSSNTNYNLAVDYRLNNRLNLTLASSRSYLPSNRPGKLYDLTTTVQGVASYDLGTRFNVSAGATYDQIESNQDTTPGVAPTPTKQHKNAEFVSLRYRQSKRASVVLSLRQEDRKTDLSAFDYSDTRATLSLAVTF